MKKTIITLLLGITAGTALAQKLSPATEVYLMQKEQARQKITAANPQAQTAYWSFRENRVQAKRCFVPPLQ